MRLFKILTKAGERVWAVPPIWYSQQVQNFQGAPKVPEAFHLIKNSTLLESGTSLLENISALEVDDTTTVEAERILAPLPDRGPPAVYACGLNYSEHAKEAGIELFRFPTIVLKAPTSICGHEDTIMIPRVTKEKDEVDYEAELAVVVGKKILNASVDEVKNSIAGFTIANDVTARRWQGKKGGLQWGRSKSFDTFTPLGPALVAYEALQKDPHALRISLALERQGVKTTMQDSSTSDMIHNIYELLAFLSQDTTILPWTVVLTGTPPGVGYARKPPMFLQPNDRICIEIEGLGCLENVVDKSW